MPGREGDEREKLAAFCTFTFQEANASVILTASMLEKSATHLLFYINSCSSGHCTVLNMPADRTHVTIFLF